MRSLFGTIALCFAGCELDLNRYQRVHEANASNDPMNVEIYELDNGLTVYLSPNHEESRFYAEIITRAGSKHDPSTNTGLAHYLEHLLFKGTTHFGTIDYEKEKPLLDRITELYEQRSQETNSSKRDAIYAEINEIAKKAAAFAVPNELDRMYGDMGGQAINAHTWHEETVYKVDLPANRLKQWAAIESERFENPVFRLFHTELETVYEEKNRSIDNKVRLIHREVNALLYKNHPYGQQRTLGSVEHLKNPSINAIEEYFKTYYVPENMAICISGDIDPKETIRIIERQFSRWESGEKELKIPMWTEKSLSGREFVQMKYQGEEQVLLAFRTVPRKHEDWPALRLLDMVLDNSVAGLINLNLVEAQAVRSAGSFPQNLNDYGAQYLQGIPKDGQTLQEVEDLLLAQVDLIKKGNFADWILPAVINDFKKRRKQDLENNQKRVEFMRDAFLAEREWEDVVNEIDLLEQVTKAEVVRVANQYFGPNFVSGHRIDAQHDLPSIDKPKIDPLDIDPSKQSAFMKKISEMPFDPFEPRYIEEGTTFEKRELQSGLTLYHAPNPINDLGAIEIRFHKGYRLDKNLPYAKRMIDRSGVGDLGSGQLKVEWYKMGIDFGMNVGERHSSVAVAGLDENLPDALSLGRKLLASPAIEQDTLDELIKIILAEREDEPKSPQVLAHALAHFHRYGDRSRYRDRLSNADLNASTVEKLSASLSELLATEQSVLYVGPRSVDEVADLLKKEYGEATELSPSTSHEPLRSATPEKTRILFLQKEMAQALVRMEFAAGTYEESSRPASQLFNEYFGGGMAGLVFQELREARALAYSAFGHYFPASRPEDENIVVGFIGCQADKTIEAVKAFLGLMEDMPLEQNRFDNARQALESTYRTANIAFRSVPGIVIDWENLGLDKDPRQDRFPIIKDATIDTLKEFYEKEIQPRPKLISIVGDSSKIDMEALAKFGEITTIEADKIFSE